MIQKNLLVVCGKLSKLKVNNSLKYIKQNGLDVDIIYNNNKNIYKGLDESIYEKSKIQINTQTNYKLCFFLSESNTEINFPNNFENVGYKNIKFISENFWYCNSLDFDIVGKFWKSNFINTKKDLYINTDMSNKTILEIFNNWLYKIRIYPNKTLSGGKLFDSYKTNKKRVAFCLSGETRSLEITKMFYKDILKNTDIEIDFFISTWKTNYENELKSISNLKGIEILDFKEHINQVRVEPNKFSNNHRYSYLMKRCNLLKQKYEIENDFVYDVVFISRPDTIFEEPIDNILNYQSASSTTNFYTFNAVASDHQHYNTTHKFLDDNFLITNSITSDVYSNIHFFYYNKFIDKINWSLEINAFITDYYNILLSPTNVSHEIIRNTNLYQWVDKLKSFNWEHKVKILKDMNNLRYSESFDGEMIIDCKGKDYLFDKLGHLTFLEHYIKQMGHRFLNTDTIFLVDNHNLDKLNNIDLESMLSPMKSFKVCKEYVVNKDKKTILVEPKNFINLQHNNFWNSLNKKKINFFNYNEEATNYKKVYEIVSFEKIKTIFNNI